MSKPSYFLSVKYILMCNRRKWSFVYFLFTSQPTTSALSDRLPNNYSMNLGRNSFNFHADTHTFWSCVRIARHIHKRVVSSLFSNFNEFLTHIKPPSTSPSHISQPKRWWNVKMRVRNIIDIAWAWPTMRPAKKKSEKKCKLNVTLYVYDRVLQYRVVSCDCDTNFSLFFVVVICLSLFSFAHHHSLTLFVTFWRNHFM